jgi:lysyl-tRNA synthetase class 1
VSEDGKTKRLEDRVKPYQVPFRHLCNLIQIADGDIEKTLADISANDGNLQKEQIPSLKTRAERAKYWVENCAPEEFRFKLLAEGSAVNSSFSDTEKNAVRILRDDVILNIETFSDDKTCSSAIYAAAEKAGVDGKALFTAAYQALIGKDQGPRLANFLRSIDKQRLLGILKSY